MIAKLCNLPCKKVTLKLASGNWNYRIKEVNLVALIYLVDSSNVALFSQKTISVSFPF